MVSSKTKSVIQRAKQIYAERLQQECERNHLEQFVTIEPDSGDFFLADTFDAAVKLAKQKYPSRLSHTIRIGHQAAFQIDSDSHW